MARLNKYQKAAADKHYAEVLGDYQGMLRVEGVREVLRSMRRLDIDTKTELKPVHLKAAQIVAEAAAKRAPRRTGRLRDSVRATARVTGGRVAIGGGRGRMGIEYAGPIHFGWAKRNIKPQPFVYDVLDERRQKVLNVYQKEMQKLIKKHDLSLK
jgi:HK97 gp10 family phage protein